MNPLVSKFLSILVVLVVVIAGFAIRMFFKKDAQFKGGCASNNPMLVNEIGECGVCGKKPTEECKSDELPQIG